MKEPILTDKVITDISSNGSKIIETIIKINGTYKSKLLKFDIVFKVTLVRYSVVINNIFRRHWGYDEIG